MGEAEEHRAAASMLRMAMLENMVTVAASAATVLGLYWMGAGGWAAGGFLLMLNLNSGKVSLRTEDAP